MRVQKAIMDEGAKELSQAVKEKEKENTLNCVGTYCMILTNHLRGFANLNALLFCQNLQVVIAREQGCR